MKSIVTASSSQAAVLVMGLMLVTGTPALDAQAVCSGPHAGPSKPTAGSIATLAPGAGWAQLSLFHHDTRERFNPQGNLESFLTNGRAVTTSLYVTAAAGLVRGVEVMAQLPVHRLRFEDRTGLREETGYGDPRLYLRLGSQLVGVESFPVTVRGGVKLVGSDFPVDAEVLPLTEGQRDYELMLESGYTFSGTPVYVRGWIGYRWREENESIRRQPGNERFGYGAVGGRLRQVGWEMAVEGLSGEIPSQQGFGIPTSRRRLVQLYPSVSAPAGPGRVEFGGRFPVDGRNFPGGPAVSLGYALEWGR